MFKQNQHFRHELRVSAPEAAGARGVSSGVGERRQEMATCTSGDESDLQTLKHAHKQKNNGPSPDCCSFLVCQLILVQFEGNGSHC